jgi:NAD+ synthase
VPNEIIETPPTAGLWKGQTDEGELGFSYAEADSVLYHCLIEKYSKKNLTKRLKFDKRLVEKVLTTKMNSQFKRDPAPSL